MSSEIAGTSSPDDKCALTETSDLGSDLKERKWLANYRLEEAERALEESHEAYNKARKAWEKAQEDNQQAFANRRKAWKDVRELELIEKAREQVVGK